MALARVVEFENVSSEGLGQVRDQIHGDPPEGLTASEIVVLHDAAAGKALAVVFFDNEDDYAKGDAALNAMAPGDTPGTRVSVTKYDVAARRTV